jgi:signal transduction histidine kinase/CheY-like chemotaxis protein
MKSYVRRVLNRYIFTDDLPFDARVFNLICLVGIVSLLASAAGHLVEDSNRILMLIKIFMVFAAFLMFLVCNKFKLHKYGQILSIIGFCDIFFPSVFFTNGGSAGGMAAYFVLTMILIVLLSHGAMFFVYMGTHLVIVAFCYFLDWFHPEMILPLDVFQHYADTIISIIIAGIFIGLIIKGLSSLYIHEKRKADAASQTKSDFLAQMSHEMRTPMNAILGMTTILKSSDDLAQHKAGMDKIETASTHLLGVINDILDMSKIEANKLELFRESFHFQRMVSGVVGIMNFGIANKHLEFAVSIGPDIPDYLVGDRQRLAQVIANLLSNAVKFTPEDGKISLAAELTGCEDDVCAIRVTVADSGIGITGEQMPRLFTSFEQADNSTSRKFGGTGLGLAISKRIIELMGGKIWAQSEIGRGSVFAFDVKLQRGSAADAGDASGEGDADRDTAGDTAAARDFSGHRILIAEDIDINLEIITTLLEPTGLTIECASNGKEAVEKFIAAGTGGSGGYDLVFMDIRMPEMDGYEATRGIRRSEAGNAQTVPIIAMTANVFKEDIDKAREAGMDDHLGKPIVLDDVLAKLDKYLGK